MPSMVPFSRMFWRPLRSGWNPVPTSSSAPTRPPSTAIPSVGEVIRASILSSVLLPEPLRPITPMTCPGGTSKDTFLSAHIASVTGCGADSAARRRNGEARRFPRNSESLPGWRSSFTTYHLPRPSTRSAGSVIDSLDLVGEGAFAPPEKPKAGNDEEHRDAGRNPDHLQAWRGASGERPPARLH